MTAKIMSAAVASAPSVHMPGARARLVGEIRGDVDRAHDDERDAEPGDDFDAHAALDRREHAGDERRERLEAVVVRGERAPPEPFEARLLRARVAVVVAAILLVHLTPHDDPRNVHEREGGDDGEVRHVDHGRMLRDVVADLAADTRVRPDPDTPGRYHLTLPDHWDYLLPSGGVVMTCALRAAEAHVGDPALRLASATTIFASPIHPARSSPTST